MLDHLIQIASHLKWACNYLLYHSFLQQNHFMPELYHDHREMGEDQQVSRVEQYECWELGGSKEEAECAVCLCKIEEGEEIRELRCHHAFHTECLDRWVVGYNHKTCPLCRGSLFPSTTVLAEHTGVEVLLFKHYCSFGSRDRETWWLR